MIQIDLDTKFASGTRAGRFSGRASVFGNVDLGADIVLPGAFRRSVAEFETGAKKILLLWMHDTTQPIGKWTSFRETADGLHAEGELSLGTQRGREAYELLKDGALDGLSIGGLVKDSDFDTQGNRLIKEFDLWETSLVGFPMNTSARVAEVKGTLDKRAFEARLRDQLGFSVREARALSSKGFGDIAFRDDAEIQDQHIERQLRELAREIRSIGL